METVVCKKCKTENPKGQDHCQSCGNFLPGHKYGFDKRPENIAPGGGSQERTEKKARKLIKAEGLDWDEISASDRMVALAAVGPKATNADRRMLLQQLQLLKPAPKIGRDQDVAVETVVIEAQQIENAESALKMLEKLVKAKSSSGKK